MIKYLIATVLLFLYSTAIAITYPIQFVAPCTNADSPIEPYDPCDTTGTSVLHNLAVILVWAQRAGQIDSTLVQIIPAQGMECDTLYGNPDLSPGHTYRVWCQPEKLSGVRARCMGPELAANIPAITSVDGQINLGTLVGTKWYGIYGPITWPPKVSGVYWRVDIYSNGKKVTKRQVYLK